MKIPRMFYVLLFAKSTLVNKRSRTLVVFRLIIRILKMDPYADHGITVFESFCRALNSPLSPVILTRLFPDVRLIGWSLERQTETERERERAVLPNDICDGRFAVSGSHLNGTTAQSIDGVTSRTDRLYKVAQTSKSSTGRIGLQSLTDPSAHLL